MIEWLTNTFLWAKTATLTNLPGALLYWIPAVVCLVGYFFVLVAEYKKDQKNCIKEYYYPTVTVGWILGRILISFIPIWNLVMTIFNWIPYILRDLIEYLNKTFNMPLVKSKYVKKEEKGSH